MSTCVICITVWKIHRKNSMTPYICMQVLEDWDQETVLINQNLIFLELADMSEYDGFLYPSTTIKEGDVKQRLLERIIESKKPCVSLEEEIPGLSFVGINQSKAMRQIVRHLAGVHGIRTFGFINGMKDTYEAQMRQQGVESKIRELGLCLMPEWVDYGNYEYRSGETYARKMIAAYEAGEELPQAVISANDLMAAAFLQTIKGTALEGKIPITGFDRYFDGECLQPDDDNH